MAGGHGARHAGGAGQGGQGGPEAGAGEAVGRVCPQRPGALAHRQIVDETEALIATPRGFKEELRSGTWACVRYARKAGRTLHIVWPDGSVRAEGQAGEDEGQE